MIDKHKVQRMFTNIFKKKLLWSLTSTRGTGFTLQNRTTAGYLPHFPLPRKEKKCQNKISNFAMTDANPIEGKH